MLLNGQTPAETGYPAWRASVMYVPQSRVNFKGTPAEFYFQVGGRILLNDKLAVSAIRRVSVQPSRVLTKSS